MVGATTANDDDWTEIAIGLPPELEGDVVIEMDLDAPATIFHHWVVAHT
jgi:hypothetical protein